MNKILPYQKSAEIQFEPGSNGQVLANLLGIKNQSRMDEAEAWTLTATTYLFTKKISKSHRFTAQEICDMHRIWLGRIYTWAGQYRQVQISKGTLYFASASHIPQLMENYEKNFLCRFTPCNFQDNSELTQALAETHVELILIHPFREGNGRLARLLATVMGIQAGLKELDFSPLVGKRRESYFSAIRAGLDKNYRPMKNLYEKIIERTGWSDKQKDN